MVKIPHPTPFFLTDSVIKSTETVLILRYRVFLSLKVTVSRVLFCNLYDRMSEQEKKRGEGKENFAYSTLRIRNP